MHASRENFLRIIETHQGVINSLCSLYYQSPDDQKDARQDIILQLWRSFASFRGESQISTWIYRVGLNTILSKIRKEKRKPLKESLNPSHENRAASAAYSDDDLQLLYKVIHSLKDVDKAIVILFLDGYKNKEIAEVLALTPSNISTRMNRIKKELKSKFRIYHHEYK